MTIGVDGCRAGWCWVGDDAGLRSWGIAPSFAALLDAVPGDAAVYIDIPIGLRDGGGGSRACDAGARRLLGPRRSSVFEAPIRPVLDAADNAAANALSKAQDGKGLSRQAFAIVPKIAEVDRALRSARHRGALVHEVHPELCFFGLAGGHPMQHTKGTPAGQAERLALLDRVLPGSSELHATLLASTLRKDVAADDITDALVALATGLCPAGQRRRLPVEPARDSVGLPMHMHYPDPQHQTTGQ